MCETHHRIRNRFQSISALCWRKVGSRNSCRLLLTALLLTLPFRIVGEDTLHLVVPPVYLSDTPILVRVELRNGAGEVRREVWDAEVSLSVDESGVGLSTDRVSLQNGLGSGLITLTGGTNPRLTAQWGVLTATRSLTNAAGWPVASVNGALLGTATTWSGRVEITGDVSVPVGHTLSIEPGTLIVLQGVASGTGGADLIVEGTVLALGTDAAPITFTGLSSALRWGQIRHDNAAPSHYRHTIMVLGGRAPGEGHTGTGPVLRPSGSRITFDSCSITDHADAAGVPGKIMMASDSEVIMVNCLLARSRMGPEVSGTALIAQDTWFSELRGPDDADGIYIHAQQAGQEARLSGCVFAGGDDDAIDTLGSDILVQDCIIRDWVNPAEDAKGISVFHGTTRVERTLLANCFVGIAAKSSGPLARVFVDQSTVTGVTRGLSAAYKDNATAGNIEIRATNSIVRAPEPLHTDFSSANYTVGYCNLSTTWAGVGNFTGDPLWVDDATNYTLRSGSPCIDAGDPNRGGDADGTRLDVGAYPRLRTLAVQPVTGVVINEIMYHPGSEDVREEYIELYNRGPATVDVSGWSFSRGVQFLFPAGTMIPVGEYLVVAADVAVFSPKYPGIGPVIGGWQGILSNSREDLDLDDALGQRVDSVRYADDGDWAVRQRGEDDHGHRGWEWYCLHDGLGFSAELVNSSLSNNSGQNWAPSRVVEGTPGEPNSVAADNVAPIILDLAHAPLIPRSSDEVRVTSRVIDEEPPSTVRLYYRVDGAVPSPFLRVSMHDDGYHDDGLAGDGLYTGVIPAQAEHSIVEFYVAAVDRGGLGRTWPAAAEDLDGSSLGSAANVLYQVDDAAPTQSQPLMKLVMREVDRAELALMGSVRPDAESDAQMNGTFLSIEGSQVQARYLVGIRNRGHGTRVRQPNNYRVNFRTDDPWKGVTALNLNAQYTHAQHLGAVVSLRAGVAGGAARGVQVRVNNVNLGNNGPQTYGTTYVANEVLNSDFADHRFPRDGSGNVYRCTRTDTSPRVNADLAYRGPDPFSYTNTYFKETNASEDDWRDLIELTQVITDTPDAQFADELRRVADVDQWLRHLAVMALFDSRETGLNTGNPDDYALYRGVADSRFVLLFYDLDTILGEGSPAGSPTATVFGAASIATFARILNHPQFQQRYYQILGDLLDTSFSAEQFDPLVDQVLGDYVPGTVRTAIKNWMSARRAHVRSLLPPGLPPYRLPKASVSGVPRSPTPDRTAALRVGGEGVTHYRFSLNDGAFGAETPVATSISLVNLPDGSTNSVAVIGRDADGRWQSEVSATLSASWVVRLSWPSVRISEVLARNDGSYLHEGTMPDFVELYNEGSATVDMSGMQLSDNPANPGKYVFPAGSQLTPGAYLVLLANDDDGTSGIHLGFGLSQDGEGVYLSDRIDRGGALLDHAEFGLQVADWSIGRVSGGEWVLTQPTAGSANVAAAMAQPGELRINEWLAADGVLFPDDFVELYNPASAPVALGSLYLTDNLVTEPTLSPVPALSFLGAGGYQAFEADGSPGKGADHVDFRLAAEYGEIGLFDERARAIDTVFYGPQEPDVSQGRTPNGSDSLRFFLLPTPGGPNAVIPSTSVTVTNQLVAMTATWAYNETEDLSAVNWTNPGYDDGGWATGGALMYVEDSSLPAVKTTPLNLGRNTYYFRHRFQFDPGSAIAALRLSTVIDDGAVFYLNGEKIFELGMQASVTVDYNTPADRTVGNAEFEGPYTVSSSALRAGDNVLAVEVHQTNSGSSDVVMGAMLEVVSTSHSGSSLPVILNEVLAAPRSTISPLGRAVDWVELYNPGTNTTDLSGMGLSDSIEEPQRWTFPAGVMLEPGGFLVLTCDPEIPSDAGNTGFGLDASGGALYLHGPDADGGVLIDTVRYGLQVPDLSVGRLGGPGGAWGLALPTLSEVNLRASLGDVRQVRINEWLADSPEGQDWFELFNPTAQPVDLSGCALTDDLADRTRSPFPSLSFLGAGRDGYGEILADGQVDQSANHVNFNLATTGDSIGLFSSRQTQIDAVSFGLQLSGVPEGRFPDGGLTTTQFAETASPGAPNHLPIPGLVINEVLAHTDPPLEDAVELLNTAGQAVDIGGYYLTDDPAVPRKYALPRPTVVPAGGTVVLYEGQFNADTNDPASFAFSSVRGDRVHLVQVDSEGRFTGYRAVVEFEASANGVSFGRHPTSAGVDFVAMEHRTLGRDAPATVEEFRLGTGAPNSDPLVGPIVISEIHYHPPDLPGGVEDTAGEFVELENITTDPVTLYDPAAATNTWSVAGGVGFVFPQGLVVPVGGRVLLVGFDPVQDATTLAAFRARYTVSGSVPVLGPFQGRLENLGERLSLYRPDPPQLPPLPDAGVVPQILVEMIRYGSVTPWPTAANGTGLSLQRVVASDYGNEPLNWVAAEPTAGWANGGEPADADSDGLPDNWEQAHGLSPASGAGDDGPDGDPDLDGQSNRREYLSGTHPRDADSVLTLVLSRNSGQDPVMRFEAISGHSYSIEATEVLGDGPWTPVAVFPAEGADRTVGWTAPISPGRQNYLRVVTPATP